MAAENAVLIRVSGEVRDMIRAISERTGEKLHEVVERLVSFDYHVGFNTDKEVSEALRFIVRKKDTRTDAELQSLLRKKGVFTTIQRVNTLRRVWES